MRAVVEQRERRHGSPASGVSWFEQPWRETIRVTCSRHDIVEILELALGFEPEPAFAAVEEQTMVEVRRGVTSDVADAMGVRESTVQCKAPLLGDGVVDV